MPVACIFFRLDVFSIRPLVAYTSQTASFCGSSFKLPQLKPFFLPKLLVKHGIHRFQKSRARTQ